MTPLHTYVDTLNSSLVKSVSTEDVLGGMLKLFVYFELILPWSCLVSPKSSFFFTILNRLHLLGKKGSFGEEEQKKDKRRTGRSRHWRSSEASGYNFI